jgi:hypothetical protein
LSIIIRFLFSTDDKAFYYAQQISKETTQYNYGGQLGSNIAKLSPVTPTLELGRATLSGG